MINTNIKCQDLLERRILLGDSLDVGRMKDLIGDSTLLKIKHLKVEPTKKEVELVLGVIEGGLPNTLILSTLG